MAKKLGLAQAHLVVDTILNAATARNLRFAAAVVDIGGEVICMARADGATALNARMCVNKAYTAVKWGRDTKALKERLFDMSLGDERRDIARPGDPRFTPVGGILLTRRTARCWAHGAAAARCRLELAAWAKAFAF
jgi:uncharacterized protein GlcG (DUF336 family)